MGRSGLRWLIFLLGVLALEVIARSRVMGPTLSVPPSHMIVNLVEQLSAGALTADLVRTAVEILTGFAIGAAIGLPLGAILWRVPLLAAVIEPYLLAYYAVPVFSLYPLFIKIFGAGAAPIIAIAALSAVGSIASNTLIGLRAIPRVQLAVARSLRLTTAQTAAHVILPSAAPQIFIGLKLGFIYALIGALASEFILATVGLGYEISYHYNNFEPTKMFAVMVLAITISVGCNWILTLGEQRLTRYRRLASAERK
ncbi:ABC transporter permease subunit [bacterium]|nr:MAG: ABC transporter permease subunit [bacterium]